MQLGHLTISPRLLVETPSFNSPSQLASVTTRLQCTPFDSALRITSQTRHNVFVKDIVSAGALADAFASHSAQCDRPTLLRRRLLHLRRSTCHITGSATAGLPAALATEAGREER